MMRLFHFLLTCLIFVPAVSAIPELIAGVSSQTWIGANLSEETLHDPVLNSQFRFMASIWLGNSALLYLFSKDIYLYRKPLAIMLVFMVFGGATRIVSLFQYGLADSWIGAYFLLSGTIVEVCLISLMLYLLRVYTKKGVPI